MINAETATPVSERIADVIRREIRDGELALGSKLPPVRLLTGRYAASHVTILRAMETLAKEGYLHKRERRGVYVAAPSRWRSASRVVKILTGGAVGATGLERWRTHLLGADVIEERLIRSGGSVCFQGCVRYPYGKAVREYVPLKQLDDGQAAAIVAVGLYDMAFLASLQELGKPVIVYDLDATPLRMDSACVDDTAAAFDVTAGLIARGHTRIVFLGTRLNRRDRHDYWNYDPCLLRRADGYSLAMRSHGLPARLFFEPEQVEIGRATVLEAQAAVPGCDAFVVSGPADIAPVTTPGNALAVFVPKGETLAWPGLLLRVEVDFAAMGEAVVRLLEHRLANPGAPVQRTVIEHAITTWRNGTDLSIR